MRGTAIDLPEALPSPSPPSSSSHFSPGRHYYVAVDRLQFKMETLVDLLGVAGRRRSLPMVICCSSRDELDAVCASVSNLSFISLSSLVQWFLVNQYLLGTLRELICTRSLPVESTSDWYSDLAESERVLVLEKFRQSTAEWSQINNACPGDDLECGNVAHKSWMIVVTDACLPLVASGEAPLLARVLINYELPTKKLPCKARGCSFFYGCKRGHIICHIHNFELSNEKNKGNILEAHVNLFSSRWNCDKHGCWR